MSNMIAFIHEVENIAGQYGLQITGLDATDVTLMVRMEVMPSVFIQIYRNVKKNKLNMALVLGNNRIYGVDSEGGICAISNPCGKREWPRGRRGIKNNR